MTINEIRTTRNLQLPIDPLKIKSMGEYDFTLLNSRNWFEYDGARRALPGILESWRFDPDFGGYHFKISQAARWSDGSQIKSKDLIINLERSIKLQSSYGKSISTLIDLKNSKISDELTFSIKMRSLKPNDSFFEKIGSIFLAIVSPKNLDENLQLKSNSISSGPFVISSTSSSQVTLERNLYFPSTNDNGPAKILIRNISNNFNFDDFCRGKTWENYFQTYSYLPHKEARALVESNLPLWTRSFDRISLFRIGNGKEKLILRQKINTHIEQALSKAEINSLPLNVTRANSIQPNGFPLYQALPMSSSVTTEAQTIKILAIEGLATDFHEEILSPIFKSLKMSVSWEKKSIQEFIKRLTSDETYDLALVSFGVADPEPSTWMSLVMDSKFIHVHTDEYVQFQNILKYEDRKIEITALKELLQKMHTRGSYIPLFWGSTLSIGHKNLNFDKIRELDETVDLSKVIFKK